MATEIANLQEVKDHLRKTTPADDGAITSFMLAATPIVESYVGPVVDQTITERHSGTPIFLHKPPVLTLVSVVAVYTGGTSWAVADLIVDKPSGLVERANGHGLCGGPWDVTYTAGRTTVAENIKLAFKIIVSHMWETQRGQMPALPVGGNTDRQPVPMGVSYAVPRRALELLRDDVNQWGIA